MTSIPFVILRYFAKAACERKIAALVSSFASAVCVATILVFSFENAYAWGPAANVPPMKVGVELLKRQLVPQSFDLPGRAVAIDQVDIRPRVGGVVTKILYEPGRLLKLGDPMFQLDDASYRATVAADKATLLIAEADLPVKQAAYDRAMKLKGQGYSEAEVEAARGALETANATLAAAKAALDYAETELSWTQINAPFDGVAEVPEVSVGDLVTSAQSTAMTTITSLDSIYVDMLEPSARRLAIRRQIEEGSLVKADKLSVNLTLEDGQTYTVDGSLVAPSSNISTTTGMISMRFQFENKEHKILPGMFVHGTVEIGKHKAFLIPQRAASQDSSGQFVAYIVGEDDKAKAVTFKSEGHYLNNWIATTGFEEGTKLILNGQKTINEGMAVSALPAEIDENGLVQYTNAEHSEAKSGPDASSFSATKTGN